MAERFLDLPRADRKEIIEDRALALGRTPVVVEKDVWVCWVLQCLFNLPDRVPTIFKGGTSLSKVYGAIARFSEDIDITLDCRTLVSTFDPFHTSVSRSRVKKHAEALNSACTRYIAEVVFPHLQKSLAAEFSKGYSVELDHDRLWIRYESALDPSAGYVQRDVLVEFGGRNSTQPSEQRVVRPYLADVLDVLDFPSPTVDVLRPERTFWEKATLIHVQCCTAEFKPSKDRSARHWYDLARLADHDIGSAALSDRALLEDVVKYKTAFYSGRGTNYEACLSGGLRLIPDDEMKRSLAVDYNKMIGDGMFEGTPPSFDLVLDRLSTLERAINAPVP